MILEMQLQYYYRGDLKSETFVEKNIKKFLIDRSPKGNFTCISLRTYDGETLIYSGDMVKHINIIKEEQDEI